MPDVICNTSPIQYLYQAELLTLLPALYTAVVIPEGVLQEIRDGRAQGIALPVIEDLKWLQVRAVQNKALLPLVTDLGRGEREVLALAIETPGSLVILDDGQALSMLAFSKSTLQARSVCC